MARKEKGDSLNISKMLNTRACVKIVNRAKQGNGQVPYQKTRSGKLKRSLISNET